MSTTLNISTLASSRTNWPNWNQRGKIKKVSPAGEIIPNEYAFGGEVVHISPRYQKNGQNYRVRPERPAVFFAAWCFENGLLPTPLTPEEAESQAGLDLLQPLFETYRQYFPKMESPYAACDQGTEPSLKVGFSFNIYQVLVEQIGSVKPVNGSSTALPIPASTNGRSALDSLKSQIEAMRSRTATPAAPTSALPPTPKAKK